MSSRSLTPPPASTDADLETTAELPVLDPPAAAAAAEEAHGATDTWAALPQLRPEDERHLETKLEALSAELRSAQQLLHNKGDRLRELDRAVRQCDMHGIANDGDIFNVREFCWIHCRNQERVPNSCGTGLRRSLRVSPS